MKLDFLFSVSVCLLALTLADQSPMPREANCQEHITDACTREYVPVCGDNGKSYSNECLLCYENRKQRQNVLVARNGNCPPE